MGTYSCREHAPLLTVIGRALRSLGFIHNCLLAQLLASAYSLLLFREIAGSVSMEVTQSNTITLDRKEEQLYRKLKPLFIEDFHRVKSK